MGPLRSLLSLAGRLLVGGAVFVFAIALVMLGIGAYLIAVPAQRVSRPHAQLVAVARALQAIVAAGAVIRASREPEPEFSDEEPES